MFGDFAHQFVETLGIVRQRYGVDLKWHRDSITPGQETARSSLSSLLFFLIAEHGLATLRQVGAGEFVESGTVEAGVVATVDDVGAQV